MTRALSGYASINGADIYYETLGRGKDLILIHALGLDCRMWDDQFIELAKFYKVLRYDLRGFGKSSFPSSDSYAHHIDLHSLLQHLKISVAYFIGLSMGGRVAIDFALTYPDKIARMVLVDSVIHGYQFKSFSIHGISTIAMESGIDKANQAWFQHELFKPARRQPIVAKRLKEIVLSYSGWHWLNKNPWTPLDPLSIRQLNKITASTLIIVGEEDLPDFHDIADILHKKITGSTKTVMHNVGHMSNMEDSETFNFLVLNFLSG